MAIVFIYAAVRVFSTATPAVRVLFNSGPHGGWVMNSITPSNSSTAKPAYETHPPTDPRRWHTTPQRYELPPRQGP